MENQNQKVYINPNFNRVGAHLNKHFSHIAPNPSQQNARRIFVNPHFLPLTKSVTSYQPFQEKGSEQHTMPKNLVSHCFQNSSYSNSKLNVQSSTCNIIPSQGLCHQQVSHGHENIDNYNIHPVVHKYNEVSRKKTKYTLIRNTNLLPIKQADTSNIFQETQKLNPVTCNIIQQTIVPPTKSRYCIIRNNRQNIINTNTLNDKRNTIKISKYKTITISTLKKELKIAKPATNKFSYQSVKSRILVQKNTSLSSPLFKTVKQSKYKYIEGSQKIKADAKESKLNSSIKRKISNRLSNNRSLVVGKYKINNIPCPLYIKYGKCLRKLKARCDYLHDRKHVSLCRKFIKGLCHDTNCLLSHELSDKKMPTCYFYLKGMCTKENCPYVHVKLSNRTKICQDFLKGYCEKGENCLERHVILPSYKKKIQKEKQLKTPPKVILKMKKSPTPSNVPTKETNSTQQNESDKRYFKDSVNENEECEAIKPIRCKLGSLPSYIQLV